VRNEDKARIQSILGVPIVAFLCFFFFSFLWSFFSLVRLSSILSFPSYLLCRVGTKIWCSKVFKRGWTLIWRAGKVNFVQSWEGCPCMLRQWRGNSDIFYECFKITKRCLQSFSN
jgi:hypothetical protein